MNDIVSLVDPQQFYFGAKVHLIHDFFLNFQSSLKEQIFRVGPLSSFSSKNYL